MRDPTLMTAVCRCCRCTFSCRESEGLCDSPVDESTKARSVECCKGCRMKVALFLTQKLISQKAGTLTIKSSHKGKKTPMVHFHTPDTKISSLASLNPQDMCKNLQRRLERTSLRHAAGITTTLRGQSRDPDFQRYFG